MGTGQGEATTATAKPATERALAPASPTAPNAAPGTPPCAAPATRPLFTYDFALAFPPHPSPESFYATSAAARHDEDEQEVTAAGCYDWMLLEQQQHRLGQRRRPAAALVSSSPSPRYSIRPHHTGEPCTNCGVAASSTWRRIRPPLERSCNSCYDHYQRRGRYRPIFGLPRRVVGVDLVAEGDSWPAVVARRAAAAAAAAAAEEEEEEEEEEGVKAEQEDREV
jgi:hypothetical protein